VIASSAFLTGRDETPLFERGDGFRLLPAVSAAFDRLAGDAAAAGFELRIASAHRSFDRQLLIFNGKARGERPVIDDRGAPVDLAALESCEQLAAILRFSALPGGSRHHWGTEVDVYDAAAVAAGYRVSLTEAEVCTGGPFDPFHCWLDGQIAAGRSHGFFRPYDRDRGGVAPERWHLSFAPLSQAFSEQVDADLLAACWSGLRDGEIAYRDLLLARLPLLVDQYLRRVAPVPPAVSRDQR
jgi:LAS superfamily LD-carboxypeptidase LdcB